MTNSIHFQEKGLVGKGNRIGHFKDLGFKK